MPCSILVVYAALLAVAPKGGASQERPDFSGHWTATPDSAAAQTGLRGRGPRAGDMGSGWGSDLTLTQNPAALTVEYMFFGRGDMQPPLRFVFALDGSETRNTVMMGRGMQEEVSTTAWEGDRLVLRTVYTYPEATAGQPTRSEVTRTLRLESPTTMVVETIRSGVMGGPTTTTRTTYTRNRDVPASRGGAVRSRSPGA